MERNTKDYMERTNVILLDRLRERKERITAKMAKLALERDMLVSSEETLKADIESAERRNLQSLPIEVSINTIEWQDMTYIGSFGPRYADTHIKLNCRDFSLAYLLAVGRYREPLVDRRTNGLNPALFGVEGRNMFDDQIMVSLKQIMNAGEWTSPGQRLTFVWHDAVEHGRSSLSTLLEDVRRNNPFKDIPIRINQTELLDALLRQRIETLCAESPGIAELREEE